jgi:LysR family nitrogen assimilation transcriptional regulator
LTRKQFNKVPAAVLPLSRNPFPSGIPYSVRVESSIHLKRMVAAGLGYGLLPFSGIYEEIGTGALSAALMPWMRAERTLALPRARPVSRATREMVAALKEVCSSLIREGKILIVPMRSRSRKARFSG